MASALALRVHQVVDHLRPASAVDIPADLARRLTPDARRTFALLTVADQAHLIRVASEVSLLAPASEDLIAAALLHDIGKVHPQHAVRVHDRVAKVVLETLAPGVLARLTRQNAPPRGLGGLWVLGRHAIAGAALAQSWGYSVRTCWLIEHHESPTGNDADLKVLVALDNGASAKDLTP